MARILVVDDDAAVQMTVRLLLERAGHSVVTADDGRTGLALCQTGNFDLLFLDIFMPGMDGFETIPSERSTNEKRPRKIPEALENRKNCRRWSAYISSPGSISLASKKSSGFSASSSTP